MSKKRKKVFVGLSGGVDSSVSTALLQEEGYDVTGVFIKTWHPDFLPCTWKEDRLDAMRVAAHLDIPFLTFDFEKEYKKDVADYMIEEYKVGRTPNPDVMCNKYVKFGAFLEKAKEMGADYVATGHYAQNLTKKENGKEIHELVAGVDKEKDQTYFLWTLTQEKLHSILFPVGGFEKKHVRELAKKFKLPTAEKKDSQGVCFLGSLDMQDFLKHFVPENTGKVVNEKGESIGYHEGALFSTYGQRHGFTVTKKDPLEKPYYVIEKDIENNTLTVSHEKKRKMQDRQSNMLFIENPHWISETFPEEGKIYQARFHYRQAMQDCKIRNSSKGVKIVFKDPQEPWAPGQSLVLYDGEQCLGGGVID
jgi:tRNA-specific 2-thiouridylase